MNLKINKKIPLIDQHDKNYMYGGKFGGNYIPETLKKPIDDLTKLFEKLRKDKNFIGIANNVCKHFGASLTLLHVVPENNKTTTKKEFGSRRLFRSS